jgi:putative sterol carrier protein
MLPPDLFERSKPEFVAPLVLYLCSDCCAVTGHIYNAGMGAYSRVAMITGQVKYLSKKGAIPSPETVMANMEAIASLTQGKYYDDLGVQVTELLTAVNATQAIALEPASAGFATVAAVFEAMPATFVTEAAAGIDVIFQFCITGADGGDWTCTVRDGACTIAPGIHAHPTCTLKMNDRDFLSMMNGQLASVQAFTSGKLKIEGDLMKSQLMETLFNLK